jgi:hypothetical protein
MSKIKKRRKLFIFTFILTAFTTGTVQLNEALSLLSHSSSSLSSFSTLAHNIHNSRCISVRKCKFPSLLESTSTSSTKKHQHQGPLYSSLFFDDDIDINWDEEDDDELNFDIQYQGSALEDENQKEDHNKMNNQNQSSDDNKDEDEDMEDDTDESYYDTLFKEQDGIILSKEELENNNDDDDDDDDGDNFLLQKPREAETEIIAEEVTVIQEESINKKHELEHEVEHEHAESIQNINEYHEKMQQIKKDFNNKRIMLQNQSKFQRQQQREKIRRFQLEERAMFLALRALRQQSRMYAPTTTTQRTPRRSRGRNTNTNDSIMEQEEQPSLYSTATTTILPTLSLSATRNYKRKEDIINNELIEIEQRLYGHRFKKAYAVYVRLLETLNEMKNESKQRVTDYIFDKVEQSVQGQVGSEDQGRATAVVSTATTSTTATTMINSGIDESMYMNQHQQERMSIITTLSLYRKPVLDSVASLPSSHTKEKILIEIQKKYDFDSISIQDLSSILRIRGNAKRRGRIPKTRQKVIQLLADSFATDLFQ